MGSLQHWRHLDFETPARMAVRCPTDRATAAAFATAFALHHGLDRIEARQVGTAASELVANVLDHGGGAGALELRFERGTLTLQVSDRGPGLDVPEHLFLGRDGRTALGLEGGRGLGEGGASLRRLMDEVTATLPEDGGLEVRASKHGSGDGRR